MFSRRILELGIIKPKLLVRSLLFAHTETCPTQAKKPVCPSGTGEPKDKSSPGDTAAGSPGKPGGAADPCSLGGLAGPPGDTPSVAPIKLVRAQKPGKCRMGFIPDEWFLFFRPITGVSGPYFLMLGLVNYFVSKEIFVMEHEYYMGISQFIMVYYATTRFGPKIAAWLDEEVDSVTKYYEQCRKDELAVFENMKKEAEIAKWRAEGQSLLMEAKKINVKMQLEAFYRERLNYVFQRVQARMNYHVKRNRTENRIKQKWMLEWILANVMRSITPEFKKQAMDSAMSDLIALAGRTK